MGLPLRNWKEDRTRRNKTGFSNNSSRLMSSPSFIEFGRAPFPRSDTLSQSGPLKFPHFAHVFALQYTVLQRRQEDMLKGYKILFVTFSVPCCSQSILISFTDKALYYTGVNGNNSTHTLNTCPYASSISTALRSSQSNNFLKFSPIFNKYLRACKSLSFTMASLTDLRRNKAFKGEINKLSNSLDPSQES